MQKLFSISESQFPLAEYSTSFEKVKKKLFRFVFFAEFRLPFLCPSSRSPIPYRNRVFSNKIYNRKRRRERIVVNMPEVELWNYCLFRYASVYWLADPYMVILKQKL